MIVQQQECLEMLKLSCSTQSSPDHKQKEIIGIRYKKKAFMLINWTIYRILGILFLGLTLSRGISGSPFRLT